MAFKTILKRNHILIFMVSFCFLIGCGGTTATVSESDSLVSVETSISEETAVSEVSVDDESSVEESEPEVISFKADCNREEMTREDKRGTCTIFATRADITHDGIDDRIVLQFSGDEAGTPNPKTGINRPNRNWAYIKVYSGSSNLEKCIYKSEGISWCGDNSAVYLTKFNGQDCLLFTEVSDSNGIVSYEYCLFGLDEEGNILTVSSDSIIDPDFIMNDEGVWIDQRKGETNSYCEKYKDALHEMLSDGAILLVDGDYDRERAAFSDIDDVISAGEFFDKNAPKFIEYRSYLKVLPNASDLPEEIADVIYENKDFYYVLNSFAEEDEPTETILTNTRDFSYDQFFMETEDGSLYVDKYDFDWEKYTIFDLDGDGTDELIYGVTQDYDEFFLIFHVIDKDVYAYSIYYKEFAILYNDGTFESLAGASCSYYGKIESFDRHRYHIKDVAVFDSYKGCLLGDKKVSDEKFFEYLDDLENKTGRVIWISDKSAGTE